MAEEVAFHLDCKAYLAECAAANRERCAQAWLDVATAEAPCEFELRHYTSPRGCGAFSCPSTLWPDGAFVAGDTVSRLTSIAQPTSIWADAAKIEPEGTARQMIEMEITGHRQVMRKSFILDFDRANWAHLGETVA